MVNPRARPLGRAKPHHLLVFLIDELRAPVNPSRKSFPLFVPHLSGWIHSPWHLCVSLLLVVPVPDSRCSDDIELNSIIVQTSPFGHHVSRDSHT